MASGVDFGHARKRRKGRARLGGMVDQYPSGGSRWLALAGSWCCSTGPRTAGVQAISGGLKRSLTVPESRPGQCIGVTSVMIGACVA
jgi:hypothetical protein